MNKERKNTVAFDFDNVIHKYRSGWMDGSIYDEMNDNVLATMFALMMQGHPVFIMSTREASQIVEHMNALELPHMKFEAFTDKFWNRTDVIGVCNHKAVFDVIVDDRAIHFNPALPIPTVQQLQAFKPETYK